MNQIAKTTKKDFFTVNMSQQFTTNAFVVWKKRRKRQREVRVQTTWFVPTTSTVSGRLPYIYIVLCMCIAIITPPQLLIILIPTVKNCSGIASSCTSKLKSRLSFLNVSRGRTVRCFVETFQARTISLMLSTVQFTQVGMFPDQVVDFTVCLPILVQRHRPGKVPCC